MDHFKAQAKDLMDIRSSSGTMGAKIPKGQKEWPECAR
jgi:hypothetical protein